VQSLHRSFVCVCAEAEREKSRAKRKPSKRSQRDETEDRERRDNEEQDRTDSKQERKSSSSKDESAKEKTDKEEEKSDETKEVSSPGIKVKTLEEILREKALKKLEERRAQGKVQRDTDKGQAEEKLNDITEDSERAEGQVAGVNESENSEEPVSLDGKDNNSIDSSTEKTTASRKVSASGQKSPVKNVIKTNKVSVSKKDNNSVESSTEKTINTKGISGIAEDTQGGEEKASTYEPPSPFQEVRVKSFEEIMQEKRKRKAEVLRESSEDVSGEVTASIPGQVNSSTSAATSIPPKRLKRIVRKSSGDSDKDTKVVSSSGAESTVSKVKPTRKRTVYVMDGASPSKDSKENGEYMCSVIQCMPPCDNSTLKIFVSGHLLVFDQRLVFDLAAMQMFLYLSAY